MSSRCIFCLDAKTWSKAEDTKLVDISVLDWAFCFNVIHVLEFEY